jgi:hypothetical protein
MLSYLDNVRHIVIVNTLASFNAKIVVVVCLASFAGKVDRPGRQGTLIEGEEDYCTLFGLLQLEAFDDGSTIQVGAHV